MHHGAREDRRAIDVRPVGGERDRPRHDRAARLVVLLKACAELGDVARLDGRKPQADRPRHLRFLRLARREPLHLLLKPRDRVTVGVRDEADDGEPNRHRKQYLRRSATHGAAAKLLHARTPAVTISGSWRRPGSP